MLPIERGQSYVSTSEEWRKKKEKEKEKTEKWLQSFY